jgi:hypothetical protein
MSLPVIRAGLHLVENKSLRARARPLRKGADKCTRRRCAAREASIYARVARGAGASRSSSSGEMQIGGPEEPLCWDRRFASCQGGRFTNADRARLC